jgi:competence protein ComEC
VLLPFLILYFHRVSFASLFLNIIVGVLMALLSFCALAALVVSEISNSLGASLVSLTEAINWLMVHSVDPFETMRLASIRLPEYSGWPSIVYGLYYVPLVTLTVKLARWKPVRHPSGIEKRERFSAFSVTRMAAFAFMIGVIIVVWHPRSAPAADSKLHVDFLDVGQGDAALVTMPDGTTVLIDGGGQPSFDNSRRYGDEDETAEPFQRDRRSIGEAVVSEYLWWRGLDHVDYIVATHADADHIDGLNAIARNFRVRCAFIAREPSRDPEYSRFAATLRDMGVPAEIIARGDSLRFGSVTLDVLWPVHLSDPNAPSRNNDSIVLRMRFGERAFLLTGDIEKGAEAALTSDSDELKCDVLKVAHHGSRSSSIDSFVNATRPSLAVISVGLSSAYGHPHKEVVERWRASGAEVLTTGQSGMISVSTDGRDLRTESFEPKPN